ncbi:MAG: DUF4286 family protein [Polyangiaceae bacterium]
MFSYVVRCEFSDPAVCASWQAWLVEEHCRDVCEAGALSGEIVRVDGDVLALESRYVFASREAFLKYESEHAPRLRAEGLAKKGNDDVRFSRHTGEIILQQTRSV